MRPKVTTSGQQIVKQIVSELERTGKRSHRDRYGRRLLQAPRRVEGEDAEVSYIERINTVLPQGIRLAHDGRYRVMLSLKIKNYILVGYDGRKILKGSSLRSRADERFGREFISKAVDLLLENKPQEVADLYRSYAERIQKRDLSIEDFARRERITDKTFTSNARKRIAEAVGKMKVGEYADVYDRQDGTLGLADDYAQDEDTKYLLDKLYKFAGRIKEAFGDDFDILFPKPSARTRMEAAGQQTLRGSDDFGFRISGFEFENSMR